MLFSLYIAYRKSRINPVKRKKPTHYKDDFSDGREDPLRRGIKVIPMKDFAANIHYSYSDY